MMDEVEVVPDVVQPTRRRRHSKEFKETVIQAAIAAERVDCGRGAALPVERQPAAQLGCGEAGTRCRVSGPDRN